MRPSWRVSQPSVGSRRSPPSAGSLKEVPGSVVARIFTVAGGSTVKFISRPSSRIGSPMRWARESTSHSRALPDALSETQSRCEVYMDCQGRTTE